jgi:hypothetical protein
MPPSRSDNVTIDKPKVNHRPGGRTARLAGTGPGTARSRLFLLLVATVLGLAQPVPLPAATIEGVVFSSRGPVAGATVYAYPDYQALAENSQAIVSVPGEREGQYRLQLEPGRYYLLARAREDGRRLFSYHGVNPITLGDDYRWLPFLLVAEKEGSCSASDYRGISGRVYYRDQPLDDGVVSVYPWQEGKFRGMGLLTNTLDAKGAFHFSLEPGTYVVIARKKQEARGIGPVHRGDLFCYPSANPVTLAAGQLCEIEMSCYPRDELPHYLAADAVNPQGRRHESRRQASLFDLQPAEVPTPTTTRPTIIAGRVTDPAGKPRPGLVVTAYPAQGLALFQMHVVRLITDNIAHTDRDGRYRLEISEPGRFYLQAREKMGEAPVPREYFGLYEGNANHSVVIESGRTLNDIDLVVDRIMPSLKPGSKLANPGQP